ncbi:MAG: alpha-ketoacid dehydrogenase subunit beta [Candidatus Sulfotelmatobacter sp.]
MSTLTHQPVLSGDRTLTYAQALNEALREEMARDPTVVLLGEDIGEYGGIFTVTRGLLSEFGPERVFDTPISEAAIVGAALGLALTGYRSVLELMFVDFAFVAGDQLFNHVGKSRFISGGQNSVPVVVRTQQGSGGGKAAQHSQCLEVLFCHMPGWVVVSPSNAVDAKGLLKAAIRNGNPVAFLEHKALYFQKTQVPTGDFTVPIGSARVVREGRDATLLAYSKTVELAVAAANQLDQEGISAEVIDLRTLKPLDLATILASVKKTNRAVIVHEAHRFCGFGAELSAIIQEKAFDDLDAPVERVAALDAPIPFSRPLERTVLPQVDTVVTAARKTLKGGD